MFSKVENFINGFIGNRANEAVDAVIFLGEKSWPWVLVGFVFIALFLFCVRVARLLPDDKSVLVFSLTTVAKLIVLSLISLFLVVLAYFSFTFQYQYTPSTFWPFLLQQSKFVAYGSIFGVLVGWYSWIRVARDFEPYFSNWLKTNTKTNNRSEEKDKTRTDARTVINLLPSKEKGVDLESVFAEAKKRDSMYLGFYTEKSKNIAMFIPRSEWCSSHTQVVGPTGTGKGVASGGVMVQAIKNYDDAVIVFDPKRDEWAPHVMAQACEEANRPFMYVDLNDSTPQINPLKGINLKDLKELLIAGYRLGSSGGDSDFYRTNDRRAANQLARIVDDKESISFSELFDHASEYIDSDLFKNATNFINQLEEIAEVESIQTSEGLDFSDVIKNGGCLYVVGSLRNEAVLSLQKMLALRLIQLIENRPSGGRQVLLFLDEIKYLLSAETINAFGTVRDKYCNIVMTHQALGDLLSCNVAMEPETVRDTILVNTPIKWIYRNKDADTVKWASDMTGKIIVKTERETVERNELLSEVAQSEHMTDQVERNLIDANMIMSLENSCALAITSGMARLAFATPIPTIKRELKVTYAVKVERTQLGDNLLGENELTQNNNKDGDALL